MQQLYIDKGLKRNYNVAIKFENTTKI